MDKIDGEYVLKRTFIERLLKSILLSKSLYCASKKYATVHHQVHQATALTKLQNFLRINALQHNSKTDT